MKGISTIFIVMLVLLAGNAGAQTAGEVSRGRYDTTRAAGVKIIADTTLKDTIQKRVHDPRKATLRSALIPGWGQAYNRQYWKVPLVYAVIGIPAGTYFYNNSWYKKCKFAFDARISSDSINIPKIDPKLQVLSTESLRSYRNEFRRNRDYSVLYTILAWGLTVVDATVYGHLKEFDVSDDLSLHITPTFNAGSNTKGLSLVMNFKTSTPRLLNVR
jgi:hypothetical protein